MVTKRRIRGSRLGMFYVFVRYDIFKRYVRSSMGGG